MSGVSEWIINDEEFLCRLTCVCVQVRFEHASGHEAPPAEVTAVRLLSGVRAHMLLQMTGLFKALFTHTAPEKQNTYHCTS